MAKKKADINGYILLAGILILGFGLFNHQTIEQTALRQITVQLSKDITNVKGRKSSIDYKFWAREYKNQFNILNGSITRGKHEAIASLKAGQVVAVSLTTADYDNLENEEEDITVRAVSLNGNYLMSQDEFYNNQKLYSMRWRVIYTFIGILLLLNGLATIPNKVNYILVGAFLGILILMSVFEIGLY